MRKFIRHPSDIPIECRVETDKKHRKCCITNIGMGGIRFTHDSYIKPKTIVHIKISASKPAFETNAMVTWCNKTNSLYDIGIKFEDDATEFSIRMIEQICHIEHYKAEIEKKEGRKISSEEAAKEWIKNFARDFPF